MIQIAIVSGKGGTGKTTLAASLAFLLDWEDQVIADCDVDAPNLHLVLNPKPFETFEYVGGKKAVIDQSVCIGCDVCREVCRFDAVYVEDGVYNIDKYACEGCNACVIACPVNAIELVDEKSGEYHVSKSEVTGSVMVHALLEPGEETSGGLVAEVRKKAIEVAKGEGRDIVVIDGAPGIGCPATSSIVGASYVVVVTEPTSSGLHDLERIVELVRHFRRRFGVVVNKYDLNLDKTETIERFCEREDIEIIGKIPFDEDVVKANVLGKPVVEYSDGKASKAIKEIFTNLMNTLKTM